MEEIIGWLVIFQRKSSSAKQIYSKSGASPDLAVALSALLTITADGYTAHTPEVAELAKILADKFCGINLQACFQTGSYHVTK